VCCLCALDVYKMVLMLLISLGFPFSVSWDTTTLRLLLVYCVRSRPLLPVEGIVLGSAGTHTYNVRCIGLTPSLDSASGS
jgi:hypothetical protein